MKKFTVQCDFKGQKAPVSFYIGSPDPSHSPIQFQADWLASEKGGTVPSEVMDALEKIKILSAKHNIIFEDLCYYAMSLATGSEREDGFDSSHDTSQFDEILEETEE